MDEPPTQPPTTPFGRGARVPAAGLCDSCAHQKVIRNTRGSSFSLCLRSRTDPSYPRYPRVPVLECAGHEPSEN